MTRKSPLLTLCFLGAAWSIPGLPASAGEAGENSAGLGEALAFEAPEWEIGDIQIKLNGMAGSTIIAARHSKGPNFLGGYDAIGTSAHARAYLGAQRVLDNGMVLGGTLDVLLYHDQLSGDNYDNDTVERLFVFAQTGFGRVEIGQPDGTGYRLGLSGPAVDEQVTLDDRGIALFRNPISGEGFGEFFEHVTTVHSSSNYSKINYISPRLFGVQIGATFTPQIVRSPLPWTGNPENDPDLQKNIWEIAASYTGYFSDLAVGFSGGLAHGSQKNGTTEGGDLLDWALGTEFAYSLSDIKLSFGGAYRSTNAYLLDPEQVLDGAKTKAVHLSATAERGSWRIGGEFTNADITGPVDYGITGYEATIAYRLNDNLELSAGWQWYDYSRNIGMFYNGAPKIHLNAGFLGLAYSL